LSKFINYTLTVRNQGEIVPQVGGDESKHGDFDRKQLKHIEFCLNSLRENKLERRDDFSYFGNLLFEALLRPVEVSFSGEVWKQLTQLETTHLRIRIIFEEVDERTELASQIINLPWEFLCYPDDNNTFLATHPRVALSYGYQTWLNNPLEGYAVQEFPLRVLLVHGHPSKLLDVGFTSLVKKILTELGETVEVKELKNPTPDELSEALKEKPHVLHFLGHGKPGALALGDLPDEETSWLEDLSLSDFLRVGGVKLVVLQACEGASPSEEFAFTGTAAQLVKTHIPAVIAVRYPISQSLAWNFVKTLYDRLAAGEPVDVAVQAGREQLAGRNPSHASRDFGAPVLWMRLRDGLLFAAGERKSEGEEEKEAKPFTDETGEVICPYQGLEAFTEETKQFFFGRVRKVEEIEQRLNQRSFVPVIGASGSGKSSVVLAGLIPRLKDLGGWEILPPIRPGDEPIARLKNIFEPYFPKSKKELTLLNDCLKKEPPNLQGLIDRLPGSERFLLVVDQFEELFTLCGDGDEQKQFIKLLSQVSTQSRLSVVITLRGDFFVDCLKDSDLTQLIQDPVLIPPMEGANLEAAIIKPAQRQGYHLEEGLLGEILQDVANEKEILPLLEFALTKLWEKRDRDRHLLTLEGYEAIGGVIGALNRHADEFYGQIERREQEWVKRIFLQLLQLGEGTKDTRKRQSKQNLLAIVEDNEEDREACSEVLDRLIDGRLLVTGQEGEDVDLAHEALIEGWSQLNEWRTENREGRKLAKQLEKDAQTWEEHDKLPDYLWRGYKLAEAEKILQEYAATVPLLPLAKEFLQASSQQELRTYLRSSDVDNLDQKALEKEAANKSFLTKERLKHLLEDEREEAQERLASSWLLEQWGEEMPMRKAEVDGEGKILLRVIEEKLPPTVVEDLRNGISLELVEIPGGEFWMGSPEKEERSERPQHQVKVSPFLIGRYPVTQAQWRVVASLPKVERDLNLEPSYYKGDSCPVEQVTWYEAVEFCERLSRLSEEKGNSYQYRLPSEAEWEYACRGGTETPFHFGQKISPALANYLEGKRGRTTPVRRFQVVNSFGLYDMHGNVWEWCFDYWHESYEGAPTDGSAWLSDNKNNYRLLRGGSWSLNPPNCRSAYRDRNYPDDRDHIIGLRVVASSRT
jgi:formylglycine-generating enzyme required for sulfatase activity